MTDDDGTEYDETNPWTCPGAQDDNAPTNVALNAATAVITFKPPTEVAPVYGYRVSSRAYAGPWPPELAIAPSCPATAFYIGGALGGLAALPMHLPPRHADMYALPHGPLPPPLLALACALQVTISVQDPDTEEWTQLDDWYSKLYRTYSVTGLPTDLAYASGMYTLTTGLTLDAGTYRADVSSLNLDGAESTSGSDTKTKA